MKTIRAMIVAAGMFAAVGAVWQLADGVAYAGGPLHNCYEPGICTSFCGNDFTLCYIVCDGVSETRTCAQPLCDIAC